MNNFAQPYYQNPLVQPYNYQPMYQNMQQPMQQPIQKVQPTEQFPRLQGKSVDSVDVVKAMDIPLDGSISYFPLTDGTAIVSKQLQQDGTSKTVIYKPVEEKDIAEQLPKYITVDEFNAAISKIDNNEFKDDIKTMKRKMQDITEDIKDINNYINKRKD